MKVKQNFNLLWKHVCKIKWLICYKLTVLIMKGSQAHAQPDYNAIPHLKDTKPNIRNKYSQKWNFAATFPVPIFMYLFLVCLICCSKIGGLILGIYKLNRSQIHECGNWERGRAVSFLGIHKSDLICSDKTRSTFRSRGPQVGIQGQEQGHYRRWVQCSNLMTLYPWYGHKD